ncbi:MAG: hypothetical protein AB7V50_05285 [Vampirovibrionia bacterium]
MLSVNNNRVLTPSNPQKQSTPVNTTVQSKALQQDTVSFNGGLDKAASLAKTKGGKLGLLGIALLSLIGVASTAKAHTIYANDGRPLAHEHVMPGQQSTRVYVDNYGNWGINVRESGGFVRNDPGDQEMMKIGRNTWQEVRRVYDQYDNQIDMKRGQIVKRSCPMDCQPGYNIPPEVRFHFDNMQPGQTIIITPPPHRGHGHKHFHNQWDDGIRDRRIERSFGIYE